MPYLDLGDNQGSDTCSIVSLTQAALILYLDLGDNQGSDNCSIVSLALAALILEDNILTSILETIRNQIPGTLSA